GFVDFLKKVAGTIANVVT
uniref:Maculatin-2.1 n=1 Tax=Ranoidea genimaculata TaxID=95132 RepID=MCU21_RANGE|nr:RecName: Full=Maculatin-2.1 [Ranoidea genimaculata]